MNLLPSEWPIEEVFTNLQRGEVSVTGLLMEHVGFLHLNLQQENTYTKKLSSTKQSTESPLIDPVVMITPTDDEAVVLGQNLQAFFGHDVYLWEEAIKPYGQLHISRQSQGESLAQQAYIAQGQYPAIQVMSMLTFARKIVPIASLQQRSLGLEIGQEIERDDLRKRLQMMGYEYVSRVQDPCTYAIRGDLVDVYPPQCNAPVRLEFWGDDLESIAYFDSKTQRRAQQALSHIMIASVRHVPTHLRGLRFGVEGIINLADDLSMDLQDPQIKLLIDLLEEGIIPSGVDDLLPCFFEDGLISFDTLWRFALKNLNPLASKATYYIWDEERCVTVLQQRWKQWEQDYSKQITKNLSAPVGAHLLSVNEILALWNTSHSRILKFKPQALQSHVISCHLPSHLALRQALGGVRGGATPLNPLIDHMKHYIDLGINLCIMCSTDSHYDKLHRLLSDFDLQTINHQKELHAFCLGQHESKAQVYITRAPLSAGFTFIQKHLCLFSSAEIFATALPKKRHLIGQDLTFQQEDESPFISTINELNIEDYIVHTDYGIGIFKGIERIMDRGQSLDCVRIEFAKKETLLLPVYRLHLLQKFIGGSKPKLIKGVAWQKAKQKAMSVALEQATELLDLYAQRAHAEGFAYSIPNNEYADFEARFPYTETRDQLRSIEKILKEMCAPKPMDHLLCGDVGFGKTEVAMRATMKAVLDDKQVAVLVPTTILALQHEKTFRERFAHTPYRIAQLSRFTTTHAKKEIKQALKEGDIDIIIGTHSLLKPNVKIPKIGLMILDEEHRFGVKDKEKLKEFKANLDVLSMTATPIPRTLHMSLSGLRSMSVIATPPRDRLSVKTRMIRMSEAIVREAILYELRRGGQIFFVHNRVQSIQTRRAWLASIMPEASIDVAHGKMKSTELEDVMQRFTEGAFQILLCTTLIETGIDIPRANTMFIDDAQMFGLAQLYQLRGRVGRSHERAYCYLLVPAEALIGSQAMKRLSVIQKFTELGSGFHVASHDLELRGAGQLLGKKQKGQVQSVGLDLYASLLDQAIHDLQGKQKAYQFNPDIQIKGIPTFVIPHEYVSDAQERLKIYRRLSHMRTQQQIDDLLHELKDRFGTPPITVLAFIQRQHVYILAIALGLYSVVQEGSTIIVTFDFESLTPVSVINQATLAMPKLVRLDDKRVRYQMSGSELEKSMETSLMILLHLYDRLPTIHSTV